MCRKCDEKFAVLNTFEAQKIVRQCMNIFCHATKGDDLHASIMADVDVQDGDKQIVMFVLTFRHLLGEVARVMVLNKRQASQNMRVVVGFDARFNEGFAG